MGRLHLKIGKSTTNYFKQQDLM